MGAIILNGAVIGDNCIIGAGSVVTENMRVVSNSLVLGVPGKVVRQVSKEELERIKNSSDEYIKLAKAFKRK